MANNDLLQRTLAHIEAHPEQWNQGAWAKKTDCGTAYCFAGTAVHLAHPDATPAFNTLWDRTAFMNVPTVITAAGRTLMSQVDIQQEATEVLDLYRHEAGVLFSAHNTLEDLRQMVADLIAGEQIEYAHGEDDEYGDEDEY